MRKVSEELNLDNPHVNPDNGLTFGEWMDEVDELCLTEFGMGVLDFGDFLSNDCWASGGSPKDGVDVMCEAQDLDPREMMDDDDDDDRDDDDEYGSWF
jgi:hypothetical protein